MDGQNITITKNTSTSCSKHEHLQHKGMLTLNKVATSIATANLSSCQEKECCCAWHLAELL
jgi:hypothetical protein